MSGIAEVARNAIRRSLPWRASNFLPADPRHVLPRSRRSWLTFESDEAPERSDSALDRDRRRDRGGGHRPGPHLPPHPPLAEPIVLVVRDQPRPGHPAVRAGA